MDTWTGIALLGPFARMDIFPAAFDFVPDPRADTARPDLCELLVVALVAVLCFAINCAGMAAFDFHADVRRVFHAEVRHLKVMVFGSGWRQGKTDLLLFSDRSCRTGFEPEAVVSRFRDVAAVGEAVEEGCRHPGVAKDCRPFAEAEVRGDDDAGTLLEFAQEVEEQRAAGGAAGQVAQVIKVDEDQKMIRRIVFPRRASPGG